VDPLQRSRLDYEFLISESKKMIENDQIHFVFIHLPVPHPPGFYDRKTHTFCQCGNYLDNLVLADQALGILRHEINQSPAAQQTTLIVSSDHSWRVPLWSGGARWTPEEAAVSKGVFDSRPVFLVHYPGQTTGSTITAPMSEIREYTALSAVLSGKVDQPKSFIETMTQGKVPVLPAKP